MLATFPGSNGSQSATYVLTWAYSAVFYEVLQEWLNSQKTGTTADILGTFL
jgi:hypothetical protein